MRKRIIAPLVMALVAMPGLAYADHSSGEDAETHHEETTQDVTHGAVTEMNTVATCTFSADLGVGAKGADVSCLQGLLIEKGLLIEISLPTGYFGELTKSALMKWQEMNKIPATGYFGVLSRMALGATAPTIATHDAHAAHEPLDVHDWEEVPEIQIELHKDALGGYNLEVVTEHFEFAPEHVNGAVEANEGHAHVYVNGKKYARLYGAWMHLPAELFVKGENEVRVTLNANDHSDLAHDGKAIEATAHAHVD